MKVAISEGQASQGTKPPGRQLIFYPIFSPLMNDFSLFLKSTKKNTEKPNVAKHKIISWGDSEADMVC